MSAFAAVETLTGRRVWDGIVGRIVEGDRMTLAVIELEPNAVVGRHQHVHEQLGIILEGSISFTVGDETADLRPGDTWRILGETPHEAVAGPDGAIVVEVFSPVRDDWRELERVERPPRWPPA